MAFEFDMAHCAAHEDELQREAEALEREQDRVTRVTLAMAYAGDYERLRAVLDYGDFEQQVFGALVDSAQSGNGRAKEALNALARNYGERFAEINT